MTLDLIMANLLDAVEAQDLNRTEKHVTEAFSYLDSGKPLGKINKEELIFHLNSLKKGIQDQRDYDKKKAELINSIINHKD